MAKPTSCLVTINLDMFLLGAEYLEAEGREDALEAVLVPLLGHDTSYLEWLWATLLWRNVDEVKLLRSKNLRHSEGILHSRSTWLNLNQEWFDFLPVVLRLRPPSFCIFNKVRSIIVSEQHLTFSSGHCGADSWNAEKTW